MTNVATPEWVNDAIFCCGCEAPPEGWCPESAENVLAEEFIPDIDDVVYRPALPKADEDIVAVTVVGLESFRAEESIALRSPAHQLGFLAGASVGLVTNFNGVLAPTVQGEVGVRLPWWHGRLLATLRAGYHFARTNGGESPRVTAKITATAAGEFTRRMPILSWASTPASLSALPNLFTIPCSWP